MFTDLRSLILRASASVKPPDADLAKILTPFGENIGKIISVKDKNRSGQFKEFFNHLSTVAEGIPAVGWIQVVCSLLLSLEFRTTDER